MRIHRVISRAGLAALVALVPQFSLAGGAGQMPAVHFEASDAGFVAQSGTGSVVVSPARVELRSAASSLQMNWLGSSRQAQLAAEQPTGGVTNYIAGLEARTLRKAVHYGQVRVRDLYPGVDAIYYGREGTVEFDLDIAPGRDTARIRFAVQGQRGIARASEGDLEVDTGGGTVRLRRPHAWQQRNGSREAVACEYRIDRGGVGFALGRYDRRRPLVIDPVIDALTWLGGSGQDNIQAIATDGQGNPVVAGVTTSPDFPGATPSTSKYWSIFVSKLNSACSAITFTTVLATSAPTSFVYDSVRSLAVDTDGSVYLAVSAIGLSTTSGAWQSNSYSDYIIKLDRSGNLVYATGLGPAYWGLTSQRLLVRDGIAYVAGTARGTAFLGTAGALQRNLGGSSDFFVLALEADGSGILFATALGGSGGESLADVAFDLEGNLVLVGTSTSSDFPLTSDAMPYTEPSGGGAVMARIDSTGSKLLFSTWLGPASVSGIALSPAGDFIIAGTSQLPAALSSQANHNSIQFPWDKGVAAYLAKMAAGTNRYSWTTSLENVSGSFGQGISTDASGNVFVPGYVSGFSGGAVSTMAGAGVLKFSTDGSQLLYSSGFNATSLTSLAEGTGPLWVGGSSSASTLPVTAGAVQPARNPAAPGTYYAPQNYDDGFLGLLNLGSFASGNFFVAPTTFSLTWRVGEPLPSAITQAVQFSGGALDLQVTTNVPGVAASFVSGTTPEVQVGVEGSNTVAGTYSGTVTVSAPSIANSSLPLPLTLTVQPAVSFTVSTNQVNVEVRQGQQFTPPTVTVTPQFGKEYFYFNITSSDTSWLTGYFSSSSTTQSTLQIGIGSRVPGTYDGTLTVSLQGLENPQQTIHVHYVVDAPAVIQLSTTTVNLHVVIGQPVTPAVIQVTSDSPNVGFSMFVGVSRTWLTTKQVGTTTPGQIQIGVDSTTATIGLYVMGMSVTSESGQQITVTIQVEVSTGAALDATLSSIDYVYYRNGPYQLQTLTFSVTAATATALSVSVDQSWLSVSLSSSTTPAAGWVFFSPGTLPEGIYKANITITSPKATVVVPVTWELYDLPHLVFSQQSFAFQYQLDGTAPAAQQLQITSPTIKPAVYSAGVESGNGFLKISPAYGLTPGAMAVSVDPTGLAAGTYTTGFVVRSDGLYTTTSFAEFSVTLTVTADPNAPKASVAAVVDAASYLPGASPGEIVCVYGSGLGPSTLVTATPDANGEYPTALGGATVYFDGVAAPIIYASETVTAVVAPFEIAGKNQTSVTVETGGKASAPYTVPVSATNPAVFTANSSGSGPAALLTYPGRIFVFYVTGMGATTPASPDGSLNSFPLAALNANVRVRVGGEDAVVQYAGPAPDMIAGAVQINIQVPDTVPSGSASLLVVADGNPSQPGVTIPLP